MHVSYNDSIDPETMDFGSYEETGRTSVDEQWKCGYRYHVGFQVNILVMKQYL